MTPAVTAHRAIPSALLVDLRATRGAGPDQLQAVVEAWDLQPLTGARNNYHLHQARPPNRPAPGPNANGTD